MKIKKLLAGSGYSKKLRFLLPPLMAGFLTGAAGYWFYPLENLSILESSIPLIWSAGVFLSGFLLSNPSRRLHIYPSFPICLGVLLAVILRMIFDLLYEDPTSHTLAGIEIFLCLLIVLPASLAGSFLRRAFILFKR